MNPVIEAPSRMPSMAPEKLWALLIFFVAYLLLELWIRLDASAHLSKLVGTRRPVLPRTEDDDLSPEEWEDLYQRAERVVEETVATLPDEIRAEAATLPCLYRQWAREVHGTEALGIYNGFQRGVLSEGGGWIVLFLGDLQVYCEEHGLDFEEQVRTTYLHELGHHLGWDEDDLESRGLG
jgi:predicted Zn-dependent protease with MMP-like domain